LEGGELARRRPLANTQGTVALTHETVAGTLAVGVSNRTFKPIVAAFHATTASINSSNEFAYLIPMHGK
jgi:hypothetical protein